MAHVPTPRPPDGRPTRPRSVGLRSLSSREIRLGPILMAISTRRIGLLLGLGVVLRVARVLMGIPATMDEGSLAHNIVSRPLSGLFADLSQTQLAPAGFLVVEWLASRLFGASDLSLRLVPLLGAVASLILFLPVARLCLRPGAVWIALALLAVAGDTIAYGAQIKQYSTDVAIGLACLLLGLRLAPEPATPRRLLGFGVVGAAAVWFSHPSAFVLAGVGWALIASALLRGEVRRSVLLSAMCLAWAVSFVLVYAISLDQLGHRRDMWAFWNFAFPPVPPKSLSDVTWPIRRFLYLFVNPLNFLTPLGPIPSLIAPAAFFLAGGISLWRRDYRTPLMLAGPGLFTLLATYLHLYPFHGRLLLFLVPFLLLPIAEGASLACDFLRRPLGRGLALAAILLFPSLSAFAYLTNVNALQDFNPLGDLRPVQLNPETFPAEPRPIVGRFSNR